MVIGEFRVRWMLQTQHVGPTRTYTDHGKLCKATSISDSKR
jgi:hypothetical protein